MRKLALLAAFCLLPLVAQAAPSEEDKLFGALKAADSAESAKPIEEKLTQLFRVSGSPSVDLLMSRAGIALAQADNGTARALVGAVTLNPREFAAMTELAEMLEDYGDKPGALKLYRRVLALDPQMKIAAERAKALAKEVEGQ